MNNMFDPNSSKSIISYAKFNKTTSNHLIGISGKAGSGKDLVGKIIQGIFLGNDDREIENSVINNKIVVGQRKDSTWEIKKFAGKIKDITCLLIGCTREQLEDEKFKSKELGEEWIICKDVEKSKIYNWFSLRNFQPRNGNIYKNIYSLEDGTKFNGELIKLTPRKLMQLLGTESGREIIHPNLWVNALFADYKQSRVVRKVKNFGELVENNFNSITHSSEIICPYWIITDVRFPNEVEAIKDRGGIVIRVNRSVDNIGEQCLQEECPCTNKYIKNKALIDDIQDFKNKDQHISETALDDYKFDFVIENNGTLEELIDKVRNLKI